MRRTAVNWPSAPAGSCGKRPSRSSSTRRSTSSNNMSCPRSTKKWTNINTIDIAKASVVVSNFNPKASRTCHIDCSMAFLSMPFSAMVMPMTVPRKPVMGTAQTITRKRASAACAQAGVDVGEVHQLIVEAVGAAAPADIFNGGAEAAKVTILWRLPRAIELFQEVLALGLDAAAGRRRLRGRQRRAAHPHVLARLCPPAAAARPPGRWRRARFRQIPPDGW